jgi:branched-chain amino acid transport system substrate-binding protein
MRHRCAALALLLVLQVAAASPVSAADRIVVIQDLTGPHAATGKAFERGFRLGIAYASRGDEHRRASGAMIELLDDGSDSDRSASLLEHAIARRGVRLVIGSSTADTTSALAAVATSHQAILLMTSRASEVAGNRFLFALPPSRADVARAEAITISFPLNNISALAPDTPQGHLAATALSDAIFNASGGLSMAYISTGFVGPKDDARATALSLCDGLQALHGGRSLYLLWTEGDQPLPQLADLDAGPNGVRLFGAAATPAVLAAVTASPGFEGIVEYDYRLPRNAMNNWLVAEHRRRFGKPPGRDEEMGMSAALLAVAVGRHAIPSESIATLEHARIATAKGLLTIRASDHQALRPLYHFRIKQGTAGHEAVPQLVREWRFE